MSTVKRLFFYVVAIINLGIFAGGTGILLGLVFRLLVSPDAWREQAQVQLSVGLAMLIIGGALWFLFWSIIRKSVANNPAETGSGIRKLYLNFILTVSAITTLSNLSAFFRWIFPGVSPDSFPSAEVAGAIVAGCVWFYHSRVENREGRPSFEAKTLRRWYVYILSAYGLITLTVNLINLMNSGFSWLTVWYENSVQSGNWASILIGNVGGILTGGVAWWYGWFRLAKDDYESTLRQVYLYLLTITGGAVAALTAFSVTLYRLLSFALDSSAEADFRFLSWTVPTMLVTGAIWGYHLRKVGEEAERLTLNKLSPRRLYLYLMSFIGLGTLLTGVVFLFSVLLDLIFDSVSGGAVFMAGWWSNQLSLSLALLAAGVPVWLYCWRTILRMADTGGIAERSARSRRIFLYTVLGTSIIAAITVLVIIVGQVINGILRGEFDNSFLQTIVWSLSVLLTAVPVLVYHWRLLREDQKSGVEKTAVRKRLVILAGDNAGELVSRIEKHLGYRARKLVFTGEAGATVPDITDEGLELMSAQIGEFGGTGVILDLTGTTVKMLPYRED